MTHDGKSESSLTKLKHAVAADRFLNTLQTTFVAWNYERVKCGCPRCADVVNGGNYDNDDVPIYFPNDIRKVATVEQCLLFKSFKAVCAQFNALLPDDKVDHPASHKTCCNLIYSLGVVAPRNPSHWLQKVKRLPNSEQIRVYRAIHAIQLEAGVTETRNFDDWFRIGGESLS